MRKILVFVGPTGSGKSEHALRIAQAMQGSILNADAFQIYRGLNIGTAKPTAFEQSLVPHFGIDLVSPKASFSIAEYVGYAKRAYDAIVASNRMPILVGGSHLYVEAFLYDYQFPFLKAIDETQTTEALYATLIAKAPSVQGHIDPMNRRRIVRALQRIESGLTPFRCDQHQIFDAFVVSLVHPRSVLYERINERVHLFCSQGFMEEALWLWQTKQLGVQSEKAIGYAEWLRVFEGVWTRKEALSRIQRRTRHLAKRQLTWLRHQKLQPKLYTPHEKRLFADVKNWWCSEYEKCAIIRNKK